MRPLMEIVAIIESNAKLKFGSVNRMLAESGLSKSTIVNMKRDNPSLPNIETLSTIAEILDLSTDYILLGKTLGVKREEAITEAHRRAIEILDDTHVDFQMELIGMMRKDAELIKKHLKKQHSAK